MNENLPCPFCGGQAIEFNGKESNETSSVQCSNCDGACFDSCKTIEEAREKWNRRVSNEQTQTRR